MSANVYAFVLISGIAFGVFTVARSVFGALVPPRRIDTFRNLFIALTAIGFLVPNFWLALILVGIAVPILGRSEKCAPVLWVAALFAIPDVIKDLPGFAGINQLFVVGPVIVISLVVLFPALVSAKGKLDDRYKISLPDIGVILYLAIVLLLSFRGVSVTAGLKVWLSVFLSTAPIYFVFSRYRWTVTDLNALAVAFVAQFLVIALVVVPEYIIQWHHYFTILWQWDISFRNLDLSRSGFYRVLGPSIVPITLGGLLMVAISFAMILQRQIKSKTLGLMGLGALTVGIIATFSRGPWVAAILSLGAREALSPKGAARLVRFGFVGAIILAAGSFTSYGQKIIALLPIIGSGSTETYDYRSRLLEVGSGVVMENPLFGSTNYLQHPRMQELIQGQKIIDIVNSYLQLALDYGLVGLGAYLLASVGGMWALWRAIKPAGVINPILQDYSIVILSCVMAMAFLLFTTTWIAGQMEEINWMLIGLSVGVARSVRASELSGSETVGAVAHNTVRTADNERSVSKTPVTNAPATNKPATNKQVKNEPASNKQVRPAPAHLRQYERGED